jgi:hypothetical protein
VIEGPLTQPRAAKVKTEHRHTPLMERFGRLVDHFVVQRPAVKRVRVADDRGHRWMGIRNRPKHGLKLARGPFKKETAMEDVGHQRWETREFTGENEAMQKECPGGLVLRGRAFAWFAR